MRRLILLAAVSLGLAACGSSGSPARALPITFGISGGNIRPWHVTVTAGGRATATELRQLGRAIAAADLTSRQCPGALPDVAAQFIRTGGRTVMVRGTCEARFTSIWNKLDRTFTLHG